jgi:predicted ATPase
VFLERIVKDLNEQVQGCTAELVFNLDDAGILDWEDRKARKVVGRTGDHGRPEEARYITEYLER